MNQHRESSGSQIGNFIGVGLDGGLVGSGMSTSRSTSTKYGDLVFFIGDKEVRAKIQLEN